MLLTLSYDSSVSFYLFLSAVFSWFVFFLSLFLDTNNTNTQNSGDIASFGADVGVRQSISLETRLDWCLAEAEEWVNQERKHADEQEEQREDGREEREEGQGSGARHESAPMSSTRTGRRRWILKPSTLNKVLYGVMCALRPSGI